MTFHLRRSSIRACTSSRRAIHASSRCSLRWLSTRRCGRAPPPPPRPPPGGGGPPPRRRGGAPSPAGDPPAAPGLGLGRAVGKAAGARETPPAGNPPPPPPPPLPQLQAAQAGRVDDDPA